MEGDAWLQELERLCLSRDENDRSDLICSNTTSSNNISHNEGNDCTSDITTSHLTSNSQTEVATKLPSQDANSTQSSSRSGAINSTNIQSTEIIDGKDGENLLEKIGVDIESYENENDLPGIMALITKDLSEPYSIYTYRYFIHNWPQICFKVSSVFFDNRYISSNRNIFKFLFKYQFHYILKGLYFRMHYILKTVTHILAIMVPF